MNPEAERPLVFAWRIPRGDTLVLLGFLGLSVFAHAATFFIFQLSAPQRVSLPPPAPQVSLLTPSNPENKVLLDWVESENPALVAQMSQADPKDLAEPSYRPSFLIPRTAPHTISEQPEKTTFPPGRDALDLIQSVSQIQSRPAAPAKPSLTRVRLSGGLAAHSFGTPPDFQGIAHNPIDAAQFLLGVNGEGQVLHAFLERSTGDSDADAQAAARLLQASLAPSEAALTWGFATVVWGDDAYAPEKPAPAAKVSPSPAPQPALKSQ